MRNRPPPTKLRELELHVNALDNARRFAREVQRCFGNGKLPHKTDRTWEEVCGMVHAAVCELESKEALIASCRGDEP